MKNVQKLMKEYKFEDAVGMFRAARFVKISPYWHAMQSTVFIANAKNQNKFTFFFLLKSIHIFVSYLCHYH